MANEISGLGAVVKWGSTVIGKVVSIGEHSSLGVNRIDTTTLDSTIENGDAIAGMQREDTRDIVFNWDSKHADAGQQACLNNRNTMLVQTLEIARANGAKESYPAMIDDVVGLGAESDSVVQVTVTFRRTSGTIVFTPAP